MSKKQKLPLVAYDLTSCSVPSIPTVPHCSNTQLDMTQLSEATEGVMSQHATLIAGHGANAWQPVKQCFAGYDIRQIQGADGS